MKIDHQAKRSDMGTNSIAELVGCSYSKVIRWVNDGLFGTEEITPGTGCTIIFDDRELEQAWACARLAEMRATKPIMRRAMKMMRRLAQVNEGDVLVVWPDGAMLCRRTDVMPTDPAWVIPLLTADEILDKSEWVIVFGSDRVPEPARPTDGVFTARRGAVEVSWPAGGDTD